MKSQARGEYEKEEFPRKDSFSRGETISFSKNKILFLAHIFSFYFQTNTLSDQTFENKSMCARGLRPGLVLSGWLFFLSFAFTFGGRRKATNKSQPKDKNQAWPGLAALVSFVEQRP